MPLNKNQIIHLTLFRIQFPESYTNKFTPSHYPVTPSVRIVIYVIRLFIHLLIQIFIRSFFPPPLHILFIPLIHTLLILFSYSLHTLFILSSSTPHPLSIPTTPSTLWSYELGSLSTPLPPKGGRTQGRPTRMGLGGGGGGECGGECGGVSVEVSE